MAEKEYIEREETLTEFQKVCDICMALVKIPMCVECSVADTVRKVKRIPAADVRPVMRGRDCMMRQYCKVAQYLGADGFCSNGEKREES